MKWDPRAALGVVMAAGGYPDSYRTGDPIRGLDAADSLPGKVFHAGTRATGPQVLTAGGRVLCAVGLGESVAAAQREAYDLVHAIHWDGCSIGATSASVRSAPRPARRAFCGVCGADAAGEDNSVSEYGETCAASLRIMRASQPSSGET